MTKRAKKSKAKKSSTSNVRLKYSGEIHVIPTPEPSTPPPDKKIHQRRNLPLVPEGPDDEKEESSE